MTKKTPLVLPGGGRGGGPTKVPDSKHGVTGGEGDDWSVLEILGG